jgi:hypothetical protein
MCKPYRKSTWDKPCQSKHNMCLDWHGLSYVFYKHFGMENFNFTEIYLFLYIDVQSG